MQYQSGVRAMRNNRRCRFVAVTQGQHALSQGVIARSLRLKLRFEALAKFSSVNASCRTTVVQLRQQRQKDK
jgi:hypothetical protein